MLVTLAGLLLGVGLYLQSFDWFLPLWERSSIVRSIQLPSRLLGPAVYGIALAGAARSPWSCPPGAWAWTVAAVAVVVLGVTGTLRRPLPLDPNLARDVSLTRAAADEPSQPGVSDSMDEFLPLTASYEGLAERRGAGVLA